ncbi:MAG: thioether cross-link-forming SCIFF peptide maturase [Oscillospiraceae bacterium]
MIRLIHKFKLDGYNVLLDVNSGGVHLVDDLTYDLLDCVDPPFAPECPEKALDKLSKLYPPAEIKECYAELLEVYRDKILFSDDDYAQYAEKAVLSPVKAMCLHIAHDCNMRCDYCFASTGDFGVGRKLMDFETGKRAIDFLIEKSFDRKFLELDFFGGEPLLNFDVVKQIVAYARAREAEVGKVFRFTITTNGLLLDDDKIAFINREMSNVVLSIDGRKEINDRMRKRVNGAGTYDKIIKNYKRLVAGRGDKDYYVRGTYTKYNLDFSEDVLHLFEAGFDQISVEPVMTDPAEPYAIGMGDLAKIFCEYERLSKKLEQIHTDGGFCNFFHFALDLDQGPCAIKRLRGCGSGNEYVAITPDGEIYPCHQFVGIEEFKMGSLYDGTFSQEIKKEFATAHVYSKPDCVKCWAKFYCSGGCNANNYLYAGDIHSAHKLSCEIQKKRLECAILKRAVGMLEKERV